MDGGVSARIGLIGDWGTGIAESTVLGMLLASKNAHYNIHLGDVYYAGTETESTRFVNDWPAGRRGSFALNSNHEMYSGGAGYFNVTIKSTRFAAQGGAPCFALTVGRWRLVGLDGAYHATALMYKDGSLGPGDSEQRAWLYTQAKAAVDNGQRLVVLTHHNGLEEDEGQNRFWSDLLATVKAAGARDVVWYWGHIHAGMVYKDHDYDGVTVHGRCAGHGGVPWLPFRQDEAARYAWGEQDKAGDPREPRRACNGFVVLDLDDEGGHETWYDEHGVAKHKAVLP